MERLDEDDEADLDSTCLKVTKDSAAWHGEAYFMGLLRSTKHVVQMLDAFPAFVGEGQAARMVFCIEMELLKGRTVEELCETRELPWTPDRVARQIRFILEPLAVLHSMNVAHRDITPGNVFVGDRAALLLGDYGITQAALLYRGVRADSYTPAFKPPDLKAFWDRRDDIYQIGLLAATLLTGEVQLAGIKKPEVNGFTTKGGLREVIKCALSVKSQRFPHAMAMADALKEAA